MRIRPYIRPYIRTKVLKLRVFHEIRHGIKWNSAFVILRYFGVCALRIDPLLRTSR